MNRIIIILLLLSALVGCKRNRLDIKVSDIKVNYEIHRFDRLLFAQQNFEAQSQLLQSYPQHRDFIDLYTEKILRIGHVGMDSFEQELNRFVGDTVIAEVADTVLQRFWDTDELEKWIDSGFRHYRYYFPEEAVPDIYTYVSGFNESLVVAENFVGLSLDKYLGADCRFYEYLGIPRFKALNMYPMKMVADLFYGWALTEYPYSDSVDHLLSNMLYQGKLLYYTEAMLPDMPDSVLIGYTGKQLDWCDENEAAMWTYLVDQKLIYNSDRLVLRKFMGDAPFTNAFGQDSPGRTGAWLGWQIVRSYMNKNQNVGLRELMTLHDAQRLLSASAYYPD
jgi:hypothetical protein